MVKADHPILKPLSREQLASCPRADLIELVLGQQDLRLQLQRKWEEDVLEISGRLIRIVNRMFGKRSERSPRSNTGKDAAAKSPDKKVAETKNLKPSERYPNVEILDQDVSFDPPPRCSCCEGEMTDSGMRETAEVLTVIPRRYFVKRQHHVKYRCTNCHGDIQTSPRIPRIKPGSSYDDATIIDVSMSKYCDLIPVGRYAKMAEREGFEGLPPQSLIELTHYLAEFLFKIYLMIRNEVLASALLYADETPHRMLEGSPKKNWYLWGFSTENSAYFEYHSTRSGDVASDFFQESQCEYLVSDVYSGYNKAVSQCNKVRTLEDKPIIQNVYCNAHARRKFDELSLESNEGEFFIQQYKKIYKLNKGIKLKSAPVAKKKRQKMKPYFAAMKKEAEQLLERVSAKSSEAKAANYFLKNYESFTRCTGDPRLPLDNNHQEALLRSPVIGRKTWYGTHSKQGAKTAAVLFTIVQSCKLNKINPRDYVRTMVKRIHENKPIYTPRQAALEKQQNNNTC